MKNFTEALRYSTRKVFIGMGIGLLGLLTVVSAEGTVINVTTTTDAPATATAVSQGVCADAQGACTLRAAIQVADAAPAPSTISLPAGTYTLTVTGTDETYAPSSGTLGYALVYEPNAAEGDLNVTQSMAIVGAGAQQTVIGWGETRADRVFHVDATKQNISVTFEGLTVQDGNVSDPVVLDDNDPQAIVQFVRYGGGIAIGPGAAIVVVNPSAEHGTGGEGGSEEGGGDETEAFTVDKVTLANVDVLNNYSGGNGGGVYDTAPLSILDSVISGNVSAAGNGGGVYADGPLTVQNTTIGAISTEPSYKGNSAENGGGIFETGSHTTTIEASSINGNEATAGGGLASRSLVLENIINSTVAGNLAQDSGGGITTNGQVVLTNDTIAGNSVSSDSEGGGAGLNSFATGGGTRSAFTMVNTIVSNNVFNTTPATVANCGGTGSGQVVTSQGHNLEDANTCSLTGVGDLVNTDPELGSLAMNGGLTETLALAPSSPAVDTGDNSICPNNDQRGSIRPADGNLDGTFICDIGAFELYIPAADLHINDMTAPDTVFASDNFEVSVNVHVDPNATAPSQGVVFTTDPLPTDLTVHSAQVTTASGTTPCNVASQVVTCDAGTLDPDEIASVVITVSAANPSPELTLTAHVSQTSPTDPDLANNTASVHVKVLGLSDLSVTSTAPSEPLALGTETALPFSIANAGPHEATALRIGIEIPAELSYRSVSLANANCTSTSATAVLCTMDSLSPGASATGLLTVGGAQVGSTPTTFTVDALQRDTDPSNNTAAVVVPVEQISDLGVSGGFTQSSVNTGSQATLSLTVRNAGPSDATGVMLVTTLASGLTFKSASGGVSCTQGAGIQCSIGTLSAGQSITLTLELAVGSTTGTFNATTSVQSSGSDPSVANDTLQSSIVVNSSDTGGGGSNSIPGLLLLACLVAVGAWRRHRRAQRSQH